MRTQVFFRNVASIQEVKPDGSNLFPNVALAEGETQAERLEFALQTLAHVPEIDTIVILPEAGTDSLSIPIDTLRRLSFGGRIKIDTNPEGILKDPSWIEQQVAAYLNTRTVQVSRNAIAFGGNIKGGAMLGNPYMEQQGSAQQDIETLTAYYSKLAVDVTQATSARLVRSSLSYNPTYGSSASNDGYINCHIDDESNFDARLVHVMMGSGTVLFDARDFEIRPGTRNQKAVYHPHLLNDGITCLTIPTGASVVIREPSPAMLMEGFMPSIHSHGIGRQDGEPEERLVERHDLLFLPE